VQQQIAVTIAILSVSVFFCGKYKNLKNLILNSSVYSPIVNPALVLFVLYIERDRDRALIAKTALSTI